MAFNLPNCPAHSTLPQVTMSEFDAEMSRRLQSLQEQGLHRKLRRIESPQGTRIVHDGREFLNFSSNDYLGLANHPRLKEAAARAAAKFGAGSGASRLICGSLAVHHQLEEALAAFKDAPASLTFSSGYATAVGVLCALVDKNDVVIIDKLAHASLIDAARLSGAKLRVFAHNDLNDLEAILKWADQKVRATPDAGGTPRTRIIVVTESVFSMDGDLAPLRELVELKEKHGAWLMLDEAHATGLYGGNQRGLVERAGVAGRVEIQMGTLGKALGSAGGYICGSRSLVDLLINRARSFVFSTAPVPAAAAAATAAIELIQSEEGRAHHDSLWSRVELARSGLAKNGLALPQDRSAILPLHIGDESVAVATAAKLQEQGVFIPAIRFPTVARGRARLRLTLTAEHTPNDLDLLFQALATAGILRTHS